MASLMETIKTRKSIRSFDGRSLSLKDRIDLEQYLSKITNPFEIPVTFVLMEASKYDLSCPVLTGETMYIAGKIPKKQYADVAFGYSFEQMVLHAWSIGIGTVWIGGTMKREKFEKAAGLKDDEMMPCISPLGYPAAKHSIKETLMRKSVRSDTRLPAEKIFFEKSFSNPISKDRKSEIAYLIEMVRWAPSAVNKQPWRVIIDGKKYHFYEKRDKGYISEKTGDLQKVDVGIALSHFAMGMEEKGKKARFSISDPGIEIPEGCEYIATIQE